MNRNGRPKGMTVQERFWEKVDKSGDCWLWRGGTVAKAGDVYGRFAVTSTRATVRLVLAHRYSWELHFGPIENGLEVCHRCDNPRCVRPDHLFLGTSQDNSDDARRKGRINAKLSWPKVAAIRDAASQGSTYVALAREYGVSQSTIGRIVVFELWRPLAEAVPA